MGQMLQVLSGVSDSSWLHSAPKPRETTHFQWQGRRRSLSGENCFAWGIWLHQGLPPSDWSSKLSGTHSFCQSKQQRKTCRQQQVTQQEQCCAHACRAVCHWGSWLPPLH